MRWEGVALPRRLWLMKYDDWREKKDFWLCIATYLFVFKKNVCDKSLEFQTTPEGSFQKVHIKKNLASPENRGNTRT